VAKTSPPCLQHVESVACKHLPPPPGQCENSPAHLRLDAGRSQVSFSLVIDEGDTLHQRKAQNGLLIFSRCSTLRPAARPGWLSVQAARLIPPRSQLADRPSGRRRPPRCARVAPVHTAPGGRSASSPPLPPPAPPVLTVRSPRCARRASRVPGKPVTGWQAIISLVRSCLAAPMPRCAIPRLRAWRAPTDGATGCCARCAASAASSPPQPGLLRAPPLPASAAPPCSLPLPPVPPPLSKRARRSRCSAHTQTPPRTSGRCAPAVCCDPSTTGRPGLLKGRVLGSDVWFSAFPCAFAPHPLCLFPPHGEKGEGGAS
jgi:hypothetical protein